MRVGTVGTNFVVSTFIEAARKTGRIEIAACYSRREETAAAFAQKNGVPQRYTSREAFLRDESLDFIYVASPNSLHYAWCRDALLAGRNVLCEKPFVSAAAELRELMALAKERGLFLFEAVTVPHLPNFKLLKQHLADVGQMKLVQLAFSQYSSRYDAYLRGENPNIFSPAFSGGALMDLGCYNLHFMLGLFGQPAEITYWPNLAENGIDTSGAFIARYPGFLCTATLSKDSKSENCLQLQGDKGYIRVPSVASLCQSFTVVPNQGEAVTYNQQEESNVLYYESLDFAEIFAQKDHARCDELLRHSLLAATVIERMRKDAGIVFAADAHPLGAG